MNQVALQTFSSFDTGGKPSEELEPERFYHGFVLGLIVDLAGKYRITSNRESGFGRYDVVMEPLKENLDAIVMEFKKSRWKRRWNMHFVRFRKNSMTQNCLPEESQRSGSGIMDLRFGGRKC